MNNYIANGRKAWVDGLRAVAMILVIFGHQAKGFIPFLTYTSAIKMPLFFVITGYVFNNSRTDAKDFFNRMLRKLIIPWMLLTMPIFIVSSLFKGSSYLMEKVIGVLTGEHTWFMTCIVWTEIIWFFANKIIKFFSNKQIMGEEALHCIISLAICVMGLIFGRMGILDFQMINRAMIAQVFVLGGYLYRKHEGSILKISWKMVGLCFALYICLAFIGNTVWPGQVIDVHLNQYFNYPFCFFLIFLGCFAMFVAADKYNKCPRVLIFIGQNTLVFYLLHMQNVQAFLFVANRLNIVLPGSFLVIAIIKTLISICMCSVEAIVLNRFFPVLMGKIK